MLVHTVVMLIMSTISLVKGSCVVTSCNTHFAFTSPNVITVDNFDDINQYNSLKITFFGKTFSLLRTLDPLNQPYTMLVLGDGKDVLEYHRKLKTQFSKTTDPEKAQNLLSDFSSSYGGRILSLMLDIQNVGDYYKQQKVYWPNYKNIMVELFAIKDSALCLMDDRSITIISDWEGKTANSLFTEGEMLDWRKQTIDIALSFTLLDDSFVNLKKLKLGQYNGLLHFELMTFTGDFTFKHTIDMSNKIATNTCEVTFDLISKNYNIPIFMKFKESHNTISLKHRDKKRLRIKSQNEKLTRPLISNNMI